MRRGRSVTDWIHQIPPKTSGGKTDSKIVRWIKSHGKVYPEEVIVKKWFPVCSFVHLPIVEKEFKHIITGNWCLLHEVDNHNKEIVKRVFRFEIEEDAVLFRGWLESIKL